MFEPDILAEIHYYSAEHFQNKEYLSTVPNIRADHLVKEDYLTCGEHYYFSETRIYPLKKYKAQIRFITPHAYPNSLWVGKVIKIHRGKTVVGEAYVCEVYNRVLDREN